MFRSLFLLLVVGCLTSVTFAKGVDVGDEAPEFKAVGVDGKEYSLKTVREDAEAVVVCFTCNNCPISQLYEDRFVAFSKEYEDKKLKWIAINVNPETLEEMKERAEQKGFEFPYALDESGESAKAYGAQVTPHLFLVDKEGKIAYIGSFDDNVDDPSKVKKTYLKDAVDAVLKGEKPKRAKTRAVGCSIGSH